MTNFWDLAHRVKNKATRPLRVGDGRVLWTQEVGLGFGNFLYLWLHAHLREGAGENYKVLASEAMKPWVERFPDVLPLVLDRRQVRFIDKREWGVTPRLYQRFGVDYSRDELHRFVTQRLLTSSYMQNLPDSGVVINVRRGDYYSVGEYRAVYGMNLEGYLRAALRGVDDLSRVTVVSDDPVWCQEHLPMPGAVFAPSDPVEHFRLVCGASVLVGTNSTFSYWGGYIGDVVHGSRHHVIMPWFHKRSINGGAADQLDPLWQIVDLPNWDER